MTENELLLNPGVNIMNGNENSTHIHTHTHTPINKIDENMLLMLFCTTQVWTSLLVNQHRDSN